MVAHNLAGQTLPFGDCMRSQINTGRRQVLAALAGSTVLAVAAPTAGATTTGTDPRRNGLRAGGEPLANAKALNEALAAAAAARSPLLIPGGDFPLAGRLVAPAGSHIVLADGARLRWVDIAATGTPFLGSPAHAGLEVSGDDFALTGRGELLGPGGGAYRPLEIGILAVGAGIDTPRRGLRIADGVRIANFGSHGIALQYVTGIDIDGIALEDLGYAGLQGLSCADGRIQRCAVRRIGPGTSNNAYGISFTHDSRRYGEDPRAQDDPAHHPNAFCRNISIADNVVEDIPVWSGIDFHGAYDCEAVRNEVYNCRNGVLLQGSSGDAVKFGGANNRVADNRVTIRRRDGGPTTITLVPRLGISVNGGSVVPHRAVTVENNRIDGYGDSQHTSFALQHTYTSGVMIRGNRLDNWHGYGCYSAYSSGAILDNEFGPVGEPANSACIYVAIGGALEIAGNRHLADRGAAATYGVYVNTPTDPPPHAIHDNDFSAVTGFAYAGHGGSRLAPGQIGRRSTEGQF